MAVESMGIRNGKMTKSGGIVEVERVNKNLGGEKKEKNETEK